VDRSDLVGRSDLVEADVDSTVEEGLARHAGLENHVAAVKVEEDGDHSTNRQVLKEEKDLRLDRKCMM
jgi:hypothetical protein